MVEDENDEPRGVGSGGPLSTMASMAQAGLSTAGDLFQLPLRQVQDWLAGADGPLHGLVSQVTDQVGRVQRELVNRMDGLERGRRSLEQLVRSQFESLRREQRATRTQVQRIAVQVDEGAGAASSSAAPSGRKRSTQKRSTAKASTARASTAKRGGAKRSTAKRSTTKRAMAKRSSGTRATTKRSTAKAATSSTSSRGTTSTAKRDGAKRSTAKRSTSTSSSSSGSGPSTT